MRLKIFSDLHFEFGNIHMLEDLFSNIDVDVFICAGDMANSRMIIDVLHTIDKIVQVPVIFVPGNHEYYGSQKCYIDEQLLNQNFEYIKILIEGVFEYKDFIFLGSTGWWDDIKYIHTVSLNDFKTIYDIKQNDNGMAWGRKSKKFFEESLKKYQDKKVICVSHNMPSHECISEEYKNSSINACFANHWDDIILKYKPSLWVCGHTHDKVDTEIGETSIIGNPYGYYLHQTNPDFNDNFIINLE